MWRALVLGVVGSSLAACSASPVAPRDVSPSGPDEAPESAVVAEAARSADPTPTQHRPEPGDRGQVSATFEAVKRLYGAEGLDVLRRPRRAELYRVGLTKPAHAPRRERIAGYHVSAGPYEVSVAARDALLALLAEDATYRPHLGKLCGGFRPGVALRVFPLERARAPLDVLFCFGCSEVGVFTGSAEQGRTLTRSDAFPVIEPSHTVLMDMADAGDLASRLAELLPAEHAADLESVVERAAHDRKLARDREAALALFPAELRGRVETNDMAQTAHPHARELRRALGTRGFTVAVTRALGIYDTDYGTRDAAESGLSRLARTITRAEIGALLPEGGDDPELMLGAARVLFEPRARPTPSAGDLARVGPLAARAARTAIERGDASNHLAVLHGLESWPHPEVVELLSAVAAGRIASRHKPHPVAARQEPSLPAAARVVLALQGHSVRGDEIGSEIALEGPDRDAAQIARALSGDDVVLERSLFDTESSYLIAWGVRALERQGTPAALAVLRELGSHRQRRVRDDAAASAARLERLR